MPFSPEASEIPTLVAMRPTYDNAGAITAVPTQFNYALRIKNDSDANDVLVRETKSFGVDMFVTNKQVTVGGTTLTYRQILQFVKKVADTERALIS